MSKKIIHDKDIVFAHYAVRNPVKLAQRRAQLEAALQICSPALKEQFKERIALIDKVLKGSKEPEEEPEEEVTS